MQRVDAAVFENDVSGRVDEVGTVEINIGPIGITLIRIRGDKEPVLLGDLLQPLGFGSRNLETGFLDPLVGTLEDRKALQREFRKQNQLVRVRRAGLPRRDAAENKNFQRSRLRCTISIASSRFRAWLTVRLMTCTQVAVQGWITLCPLSFFRQVFAAL